MKGKNAHAQQVEQSTWRNWALLVMTSVLSTTGLAVALFPMLKERMASPWAWRDMDVALLGGLSVTVVAFTLYLTLQQRRVLKLRHRLESAEAERAARTQQHYERLMALARVSRIMSIETDLKAVFDAITRTCHEMFECQRVSLMLLHAESCDLVVQSVAGDIDASTVLGERQKLGEGVSGWVAEHGRPMVVGPEEMKRVPRPTGNMGKLAQAMVVPIVVRDQFVGVLNVGSTRTDVLYDEEDLKALEVFAENAGTCIRHTEQAEWMRKTIQRLSPKQSDPAATHAAR